MFYVFFGFGCEGGNILFLLIWFGVFEGIKSFVVIVYDLDVFIGSGWWYWIVVNILVIVIYLFVDAGRCDGIKLLIGVV